MFSLFRLEYIFLHNNNIEGYQIFPSCRTTRSSNKKLERILIEFSNINLVSEQEFGSEPLRVSSPNRLTEFTLITSSTKTE